MGPTRSGRRRGAGALALAGMVALGALATLALAGAPARAQLGAAEIRVLGLAVDLDTRPDLEGLQHTMTAVRDVPTGVETFLGSPVDPAQRAMLAGTLVRAELSGPSTGGEPIALAAPPNQLLELPLLRVAGEHRLANVRLESADGEVLLERDPGLPPIVIDVIDELLVTSVTSRALTLEEIQERGIVIDEDNFTAFNFAVALTLGSEQVTIDLPVLIPTTPQALASPELPQLISLEPEPEQLRRINIPNFTLAGFGLRAPPELEENEQQLIPPIHGVIVIPGNIGFLNQFFSVILQATNAAPEGSGLTVEATRAKISLPLGGDGIAGTGDDPLRVAETVSGGVQTELPLLDAAGSDAIAPQRTHAAEFLVEGLREGTHRVDFDLRGRLFVPALGRAVELTGVAAGVVQVRNPTFSLVLAHPRTVRAGEAYRLFVTVTNTSATPANFFRLELARRSLSGARYAEGETGVRTLDTLPAGGSQTFAFDLVAQTTGEVTGTVFLADEGVNGSFVLTTGVGDRNIPLSPDTLVLPQTVDYLPDEPDLVAAAVRVLGMAYSVATAPAGALPPDVARVGRAHVFERAVKLAQVGLHVRFGESETAALADLLLDWLGNDRARLAELHPEEEVAVAARDLRAFDALRRTTDAGHDFDEVAGALLGRALAEGGIDALQREIAERFASRPALLSLGVSATGAPIAAELRDARGAPLGALDPAAPAAREIPYASRLPLAERADGGDTLWLVASPEAEPYTLALHAASGASTLGLSLVVPSADGEARLVAFPSVPLDAGGRARVVVTPGAGEPPVLEVDADGDGGFEAAHEPLAVEPVADAPPSLVGVHQWAKGALPDVYPSFERGDPIGRMVGVLFDEEVTRATAEQAAFYRVPDNRVLEVSLQPDRRLAFLMLAAPVGPFVERELTVHSVRDWRGLAMEADTRPIQADPERGTGGRFLGRVVTASGAPVPFARVRYIQPLFLDALFECFPKDFEVASFVADREGRFAIDFVLQNAHQGVCTADIWLNQRHAVGTNHFKLEAEDPETGEVGRLSTRVQYDGQTLALDVILRGYGTIEGRLLDEEGGIVPGGDPGTSGSLQVVAHNLSTGELLTSWVDAEGRYAFPRRFVRPGKAPVEAPAVPVGNVALTVVRPSDGATAVTTVNLPAGGARVEQDLILLPPFRYGVLEGVVLEADGRTPAANVFVQVAGRVLTGFGPSGRVEGTGLIGTATTDASGAFRLENVPAGAVRVVAQRASSFEEAEAREIVPEGGTARVQIVLPGTGGTVRGLVIDAFGNPVPDARVAGGTTLTNAGDDGRFEIRNLPRGTVTIYGQGLDSPALGTVKVTTTGPHDEQEIVIVLEPVGTVTGTVFEADGVTPVPSQKVQLWVGDKGVRAETFTGPDGRYTFRNQPLGPYNVRAIRRPDLDGGMALTEIRFAGDTRVADVVFRGKGSISGRVIQSNGTPVIADVLVTRKVWRILTDTGPIDNAALALEILGVFAQIEGLEHAVEKAIQENALDQPANEFFMLVDETAALRSDILGPGGEVTGRFSFTGNATGGPFTVAALGPFLAPAEVRGEIPRTFDPDERHVDVGDIVLEPATGALRGTVYMPDGVTPVGEGVAVRIRSLDSSGSVMTAVGDQQQPVLPEYQVETDENGQYAFPVVLRGRFVLTADTGVPPSEIRADGPAEMETERFADENGERLLNVRLRGRTTGSVPLLPFGEYMTADIRLADVAGVRVRVVDVDGETPVEGARVTLATSSDLDEDPPAAFTDAHGEVDFFPVIEGDVSVTATLPGSPRRGTAAASVPVDPPNGLEIPVTVRLGAATTASGQVVEAQVFGTVEGTVLRADGAPLDAPAQVVVTSKGVGLVGTSGPDGRYRIENVPGGPFRVDAFEPNTARRGTATGRIDADGQTVEVPVTLIGLGTVTGSVFSNDGTRTLGGIDVELAPSGNFSDRLVTRTDPAGSYVLSGVPLGVYTVRARDFQSGLTGEESGVLRRDGEIATTDVRLEPSGGITGRVYAAGVRLDADGQPLDANGQPWPDAPVVVGASVQIRRGPSVETVQTGPDGSFASSGFLRVGEYELLATPPLGSDGATARARVRFDGDVAYVPLALAGRGVVEGVVLDSLGAAPIEGASVTLSSESPFAGGARSRITDAEGRFRFEDVPVGAFSIAVRTNLQVPPLGGAADGVLEAHGQQIAFADGDDDPLHEAIRLQAAGAITARVLREDGTTPADGAVVLVEGGGLRLSRLTDALGEIRIEGLPLGSYALSVRDPASGGVAARTVELTTNGEELALGDLVLDASAPRVLASAPEPFAANVAPSAEIVVRFDEPIDASSVTAQTFVVRVAGTPVAGTRELREAGTAIAFVPAAPLPDLQPVEVVVHADRLGFEGQVLAAGVRDLSGLSLAADHVFSFTTGDSQPPELVSLTPADGAVEVDPSAVVRFAFSEPVDPASVAGFTLTRSDGALVPGRLEEAPIQGGRVLVFTPDVPLAVNETYTAVLHGPVRDLSGNAMPEAELRTIFATLDTRPPVLASFELAPGSVAVSGATVVLAAALAGEEPGARVEFSLGGALLGVAAAPPYTHALVLAPELGPAVTLRAVAVDAAGNRSPPRDLVLAVAANQPPMVSLVRPASGPVSQGELVTVEVAASDDAGLAELRFVANDGAVASGAQPTAGTSASAVFTFTVPADAPVGSTIAVRGSAVDVLGAAAQSATTLLEVGDALAPAVTIGSPPAGATFSPGVTVTVLVRGDDASGIASLALAVDAVGFAETRPFAPAPTTAQTSFTVPIPADAPAGNVTLVARATDGAGNEATRLGTIRIADARAPAVRLATAHGSAIVEAGGEVAIDVVAEDDVGVVRIELDVAGQDTEVRTFAAVRETQQRFALPVPADLPLGATLAVAARAFDAAGNAGAATPLVLTVGDESPPALAIVEPAAGARVTPGATFTVRVAASDATGVAAVALAVTGAAGYEETRPITPPQASVEAVFEVAVPADAATGAPIAIGVAAVDAGGREATATRTVHVADVVPPAVIGVDPGDGAAGVDPGALVRVTFSEPIEAASVTPASLALTCGGAAVAGGFELAAGGTLVTFTPAAPLPEGALCAISVTAEVRDLAGNALAAPFAASFTVRGADDEPPVVVAIDPADGASDVALDALVRVTFSEPVAPASVTAESVVLETSGGAALAATRTLEAGGLVVVLAPAAPLAPSSAHQVRVTTAITDLAGNALAAPATSRFTTAGPDLRGPRLVALEPADGATGVSVRPVVRACFDEPLDPASFGEGESAALRVLDLAAGSAPRAGTLEASADARCLSLVLDAPLAFETAYAAELLGTLRGADGNPVGDAAGAPFEQIVHGFETGRFAVTAPAAGEPVVERTELSIEASGSAALGIAQVVFEVNDEALPPVTSAPFRATVTVPPAATTTSLVIRAVAFDAEGAELASDAILVPVVLGLRFEHPISGVPLGEVAVLRLLTSSPLPADLAIELAVHDASIVDAPASAVLPAGETEVAIPVSGRAEGATALVATSSRGVASTIAAVSEARPIEPGAPVLAAPQGVSVRTFPSLGHVHVPAGATRTLRVRLLATPAPTALPVAAVSDDPAVVALGAAATIPAGDTSALLTLVAGAPGEAKLVLRAGGEGRELRVVVGDAPPRDRTTPVLAAPVGALVVQLPSAGSVIVGPSGTTSVTVPVFTAPVASATRIVVTSSAPEVAAVTQEVVVPVGSTDVTLPIQTGVAGEALLVVRPEGDPRTGRELRVVVGAPEPGATPPVVAAPIGVTVTHLPSAGTVIVAPGGTAGVTVPFFTEPLASATRLVVTSSAPDVAAVTQEVVVPAGATDVTLPIETGVEGEALLTVRPENDLRTGRELRIVVGMPAPGATAPVLAPPVGALVVQLPSAGTVIVAPDGTAGVTMPIFTEPVASATRLVVTSSAPEVAAVTREVVVPADATDVTLPIETGVEGEALLVVRPEGDPRTGRELRVVVGTPAPGATPPVLTTPIGIAVREPGTLATLFLEPGAERTVTLDLFPYPSLADLPVRATSRDPSVATVSPAQQVLPVGERSAAFTVRALGDDGDEALVEIEVAGERRTLLVVVGVPAPERRPNAAAPPVGVEVGIE